MTISDAVGSNSVQLANGLDIASSRVAPGALQLTLVNGSVITVLGAAAFGYEAGGNRSAGIDGADLSYAAFALQVLGVAVPASGIAVGGPVVIGATGPTGTITVPSGLQGAAVEFEPLMGPTFVNFDPDGNGNLVAIALLGLTDSALVQVEVV